MFFHYGQEPPYMSYGVADSAGTVLFDTPIELPGPRSPHDIGVTRHCSILHVLPYFQDPEIFPEHRRRVLRFHPEVPARFGILPRHGRSADVRGFDAKPCYSRPRPDRVARPLA